MVRSVHRLLFAVHALGCLTVSSLHGQIQDNSFLLEEAYNQEAGVVQHIIRHQISYTVPLENVEGFGVGLGDLGLNYRYQLAGNPDAATVVAPRFTVLFPTGSEEEGRGTGGIGFQVNLPVTLVLSDRFVTHWNAGATLTPSARNELGESATTHSWNFGASLIWLLRPSFNLMLEGILDDSRSVVGEGQVVGETGWVISPGLRWAIDASSDLQIVPGIAYNIGLGEGPDTDAVFLYLSFEHPFKRQ
jgi:hypothetical protein